VVVIVLQPTFRRAAVRRILGLGLCAGCAYELSGAPAGADGCRVCPECGAAWRVA
jgi:hypothetical protein